MILSATDISRVGVVGGGTMGAGIAEVCAGSGAQVMVAVRSAASLAAARKRVVRSLDRSVAKGRLTPAEHAGILDRITFTTSLEDLADRHLVVESIAEDEPAKLELFAALDRIVTMPDSILATNTSSLSIARIAKATSRPESVVGLHFFNPVPALPLVEIVGCVLTDDLTCKRAENFVTGLGKQPIRVPDRAGFVVNALLFPYLVAAIRMVETGHAPAEAVDQAMVLGCSHPMGPLKLADLIGLDTVVAIANALYAEFKDPLYAPPPLLLRLVEAGLLGRKSGRGFYAYG